MSRQAGAARWTYNWGLSRWREQFKAGGKPSWMALHKELTAVKRQPETAWLGEVSAYCVREAMADLGNAYKHFFRRLREGLRGKAAGEPNFRRRNRPSGKGFRIAQPIAIDVRTDAVKLAGIGWVKLAEHDYIPTGANYRGISARQVADAWYVSVLVGEPQPLLDSPRAADRIGVELGVRILAHTSDGNTYGAIRDLAGLKQAERRRKLWERRMARRYQKNKKKRDQSTGWQEAVRQVARLHARVANIRRDTLHQTTTRIVRKARGATLVMRDMQVARMIGKAGKTGAAKRKRNRLAPMVAKVGMYEFRTQIEYKQKWRGAPVEIAPADFPSTRKCNACGVVRATDPGYPAWTCGACGDNHDRELNSSYNLKNFQGESPGNGGQAVRQKKTPSGGKQRPAEPDYSAAGVSTTPTVSPDGRSAVSAALASLGTGNRADGAQASPDTGVGNHAQPEGRHPPHDRPPLHLLRDRRGDETNETAENQPLASRRDGPDRGSSQEAPQRRESS